MPPQTTLVLYFVIPLWLAAGVADWLCHRRSHIESTSGAPESALHLLMLGEVGLPLLGALYLDVNALVLGVLVLGLMAHEATAFADVWYAASRRRVGVVEQFVHSVLEMSPLLVLLLFASLHWGQWRALLGLGPDAADFSLRASPAPPPAGYTAALAAAIALLALAPYVEELLRSRRTVPVRA